MTDKLTMIASSVVDTYNAAAYSKIDVALNMMYPVVDRNIKNTGTKKNEFRKLIERFWFDGWIHPIDSQQFRRNWNNLIGASVMITTRHQTNRRYDDDVIPKLLCIWSNIFPSHELFNFVKMEQQRVWMAVNHASQSQSWVYTVSVYTVQQ